MTSTAEKVRELHALDLCDAEIARRVMRTRERVAQLRRRLQLGASGSKGKQLTGAHSPNWQRGERENDWTDAEDQKLMRLWPSDMKLKDIVAQFRKPMRRTHNALCGRAKRLGLTRPGSDTRAGPWSTRYVRR